MNISLFTKIGAISKVTKMKETKNIAIFDLQINGVNVGKLKATKKIND